MACPRRLACLVLDHSGRNVFGVFLGTLNEKMSLTQIKDLIEMLPHSEKTELTRWLQEQVSTEDTAFDTQIKADAAAGKLDWLVKEAMEEDAKGETTPLSL